MDGGRLERQRKKEQGVCLSVSSEGEGRGRGEGYMGNGVVQGELSPHGIGLVFRNHAINIIEAAKCRTKDPWKEGDGKTEGT